MGLSYNVRGLVLMVGNKHSGVPAVRMLMQGLKHSGVQADRILMKGLKVLHLDLQAARGGLT